MIAEIRFNKDLIVIREEADTLKLLYNEPIKLGLQEGELQEMGTYSSYYIKGVDVQLDEKTDKYLDKEGKEIGQYYLYDPITEIQQAKDYIILERSQLVDLFSFAPKCKYEYSIIKTVVDTETVSSLPIVLAKVESKVNMFIEALDKADMSTFNQKCNVHVGGGLIVTYNDTMLLEDACTDLLQTQISDGWRIVACVVQANQRRPDYVLGRYNPNLDSQTEAKRSQ